MQKRPAAGFTLLEMMVVVAIIGLLAAIAIPNFLRFQARARTAEAKTNLKGFFISAKSYFAERSTYACVACGFSPERNNIYNYSWGGGGGQLPTAAAAVSCTTAAGPTAGQSQSGFTATAMGQIDADITCDGWSISDYNNLTNFSNDVDN